MKGWCVLLVVSCCDLSKQGYRLVRELKRKERGKYEMERMIARYEHECGECKIIKVASKKNEQRGD